MIPDPAFKDKKQPLQTNWLKQHEPDEIPAGYLMPVAYLWTRTVICKNPACKATVPLVKQTWLCKKKDRYVALKMIAPRGKKQVRFEVVEAHSENGLGFDPASFSKGGNATCPFCGTVADSDYVKAEGCARRLEQQMMGIVCTQRARHGKVYLAADDYAELAPDDTSIRRRLEKLCEQTGLSVPDEPIINDAKNANFCLLYGVKTFGDLFTPRQMLCLLAFAAAIRSASAQMQLGNDRATSIVTGLGCLVDKISTRNNNADGWDAGFEKIMQVFGRQAIPMVWDFAESNPLVSVGSGNFSEAIDGTTDAIAACALDAAAANVSRGSSTVLPYLDMYFDAVITDPPYYDNVPYANISDFFYIWLKRTVGQLYPEHFAATGTPKNREAVADATRHGGSKQTARMAYEQMMAEAFAEAHRVLKAGGQLVIVYAHKTTLGWATLVDALRRAGFIVTEAWPLDTEGQRLRAVNSAALASSIFLIARKRDGAVPGNYEETVKPELEQIVRERVETLWDMGISGADLVVACVGAGLRAFTRFARVEYANGEEVPAERFLSEVETVVLETILRRLSKEVGSRDGYSLAGVDPATRFYLLWRYTYRAAELDAGEAIIFANGTHVELDGPDGLSTGARALIEKKKGKYRLLDYTQRGEDDKLGMPDDEARAAPLIDALHRVLWLMENRPGRLAEFLSEAQPNREQMRLVAQALAGPALKGSELADLSPSDEMAALAKLTANWRSVIEEQTLPLFR